MGFMILCDGMSNRGFGCCRFVIWVVSFIIAAKLLCPCEGFALSSKGPSAGGLAEAGIRIALRLPQDGKPEGKSCL